MTRTHPYKPGPGSGVETRSGAPGLARSIAIARGPLALRTVTAKLAKPRASQRGVFEARPGL